MKINYKIVSGILASVWLYDSWAGYVNTKRFDDIKKNNEKLREVLQDSVTLNHLFVEKLNENHIPMDDFTKIALKTIMDK